MTEKIFCPQISYHFISHTPTHCVSADTEFTVIPYSRKINLLAYICCTVILSKKLVSFICFEFLGLCFWGPVPYPYKFCKFFSNKKKKKKPEKKKKKKIHSQFSYVHVETW